MVSHSHIPNVRFSVSRPEFVIAHDGRRLKMSDLPPADTKRWVIKRKADVVSAILGDMLSIEEASEKYDISHEELESWIYMLSTYGVSGLRTTHIRKYRQQEHNKSE